MNSAHRATLLSSWSSLLTLFSWNLKSDIWECIEGCGEKGYILRWKLERSILRNCIVMCECNTQGYSFLFTDQFANTVFLKSARGYFLVQRSLQRQRKYPQIKSRKKLSENVLCDVWIQLTELHLSFMEQFANTTFLEAAKGYLGARWGLWWQRKYP